MQFAIGWALGGIIIYAYMIAVPLDRIAQERDHYKSLYEKTQHS